MTSASEHTLYYRVQPVPPPTVNKLTSRQKAQLRRSTTKLAKVLGEAPQVVDDLPPRIPYVSPPKKLQPSLSITSGKAPLASTPRRARSAATRGRVDPDLYPLSATLRPVPCDVRRSSESRRSRLRSHSSSFSRSISSEYLVSENENGKEDDEKSSFIVISTRPQTRPDSIVSTTTKSRDSLYSLCDSVLDYEPTFRIPSATKIRREKMARVCKILGEDVPVHLVFPIPRTRSSSRSGSDDLYLSSESSNDSSEEISSSSVESDAVLDIYVPPLFPPTPQKERQMPPPSPLLKLRRKPVPKPPYEDEELKAIGPEVPLKPSKPPVPPKSPELQYQIQAHMSTQVQMQTQRWQSQQQYPHPLTYRASRPNLETIIEQSPRASYSSSASADTITTTSSRSSLLTATTSSSYRFTSSGCLSSSFECSPVSSEAHEIAPLPTPIPVRAPTKAETATPAITATWTDVPVSNSGSANPASRSTAAKGTHGVSSLSSVTSFSSSSGTHNRREFAIYAPFRRLRSSTTSSTPTANNSDKDSNNVNRNQECELVRGMLDLRV